jgi:predicted metal-dependent HD superfamily phosphohydrolase
MPTDELRARWAQVMPDHPEMGEDLLRRYAEPHRRYHTLDHLESVLTWVDELASGREDLYLVRLAAWFHDAVYDVPIRELTNEEASARLAIRTLARAGLEQEDLTQVARLVRLTETHVPGSRDREGELLCDADLAILAAPPAAYDAYVRNIREEYASVPDQQFLAGRLQVLTDLAGRELFRTGKGRRLATPARANLEREMAALIDQLGPVAGSNA